MEKSELITGVNQVDTSPETVDQEWNEIAADEKITSTTQADGGPGMEAEAGQDSLVPDEQDREKIAEKLASFLKKLFKWGFHRFAPGWRVTEDESGSLGDAWSAVIIKYLPGRWLRFVPGGGALIELDALMITIDVVEPRLKIQKNSEHIQNAVSGEAAPAVDQGKKPVSENSRKDSGNPPETMPEIHDIEGGQ